MGDVTEIVCVYIYIYPYIGHLHRIFTLHNLIVIEGFMRENQYFCFLLHCRDIIENTICASFEKKNIV